MSILHVAIILFALAAVFGLTMAVLHFKGQTPPKNMHALLHGVFAASGLVVLLAAVLRTGAEGARGIALGLFLVAALGGWFAEREELYRGAGAIGSQLALNGDAQHDLLARFGRDEGWLPSGS